VRVLRKFQAGGEGRFFADLRAFLKGVSEKWGFRGGKNVVDLW
jgi:hypothetical protein